MLKVLLALLVLVLTAALWLLADTLDLPSWAPAWATVAAIALLVLLVVVELLRRRSRSLREARRAAERSTLHQVLLNLRSRCEHATETLRQQNAEALPWFALVGPAGAGKTAALRSSGLAFREGLGPERFIAGGDVSPTDNVQFIASDRAVYVDTAGRYLCDAADHDDRREWLELLALLRAQRGARPLAGVVLALSAPDLAGATPEDAANLGHTLRRRLDDIQREFAAALPVYLLVTKLDLLAGLGRLLAEETGDRFGLVVELSGAGASAARRVAEGPLAELTLALERRAFARLGHAAVAEERGELYRSPGLFRQLADRTSALVAAVFPDHGEADAPIWRGLFFASAGSTTPTPVTDPELQQIAREYNSPPQQGELAPPPLPRPLFLRHFFTAQLPGDAWIAAPSQRQRSRLRARQVARTSAAVVAAAALFVLTLESSRANHRLIGEVSAAIAAATRDSPDEARPIHPQAIAPLQDITRKLLAYREHGAPWSMRLGLYQGEDLSGPALATFRAKARDRLVVPLVQRARDLLVRTHNQHKDSTSALHHAQFWATVDALHLYLLLTQPSPTNTVRLADPAEQRWLADELTDAWLAALGLQPRERAEARAFAEHYLPFLAEHTGDLPAGDETLIDGVRLILRRTGRGDMWVDDLAASEIPGTSPILLSSIAAGNRWLTNKDKKVHAAFTRKGWDHVRSRLRCALAETDRYLVAAVVIDRRGCEEERSDLHGHYFERYIQEWQHFIDDVFVTEPDGPTDRERYTAIHQQIMAMTTPGGANTLERLFRVVGENAQLPEAEAGSAGGAPNDLIGWAVHEHRRKLVAQGGRDPYVTDGSGVATVARIRDAFHDYYSYGYVPGDASASAPLKTYINDLAAVGTPLGQYNQERTEESLAQARERAKLLYDKINNEHLVQRDPRWTSKLRGMLEPPIRGLLDAITRGQLDTLTDRWCQDVIYPFDHMRNCYPFSKVDTCEIQGEEIASIFQPQNGSLWKLYHEALASKFPYSGDRYTTAHQGYGSRIRLDPRVAEFLTHAKEFSDVLFPLGSPGVVFNFSLQFRSLENASNISLIVDGGKPITFNNSNRDDFQAIKWPGEGGAPGARLEAATRRGAAKFERIGYWGLFRLFELGNIQRTDRVILVTYRFTEGDAVATLRIHPSDGFGNPLFGRLRDDSTPMDIFRPPRLDPPRNLFIGGKSCKPAASSP